MTTCHSDKKYTNIAVLYTCTRFLYKIIYKLYFSVFRCGDKVSRIEQCPLGSVFVCSYGSARHGVEGCRRTYLSYRDMEAHVKHRHAKKDTPTTNPQQSIPNMSQPPPNMANPPPQYLRPPMMPPHGIIVTHPPPNMAPSTSVPPPVLAASHPHHVQRQMPPIQAGLPAMPGASRQMMPNNPVSIQTSGVHHNMPGHVITSHQQMPPGPRGPVHPQRHIRPQSVNVRPHMNQSTVSSKSHGNLISIPIQGAGEGNNFSTWRPQGNVSANQQQQWPMNNRGNGMSRH